MKYILLLFLFVFIGLANGQDTSIMQDLYKQEMHGFEKLRNARRSVDLGNYNILHNVLYLELDPEIKYIQGNVKAIFRTNSDHDSIGFDLHRDLRVDSVFYDGNKIQSTHKGDKLTIFFNSTIPASTIDSVQIYYQGKPAKDENYFSRVQHLTGHSIHTLSEPYGAMYWWPCKQGLEDKIDSLDVFIETDTAYKAASNGLLVNEYLVNDSTIVYHWKHRYPIATYLVAVAVTNFKEYSFYAKVKQGTDSVFVQNYLWPQSLKDTLVKIPLVAPMLNLFDSLFGTYPFIEEKYGHAQFAVGGGMEHQTMSFMGNFDYDLIAHELAHQWFGDKVTCGNWESLWINEGFATYLNALVYEYLGTSAEWHNRLTQQIEYVTSESGGSIFPSDTLNVRSLFDQRLTYQKASLMIHMLRWNLGDSLFYKGTSEFLESPKHAYGFGETNELKGVFENISGKDLTYFFDDWFYGEGYPIYDIVWGQEKESISLTFNQKTSHFSVDFFENPVQLLFQGETEDSLVVFDVFEPNYFEQISLPFKVENVLFDPNVWLLAKANIKFKAGNNFSVYPNPSSKELNIQVGNSIINEIRIYNMQGELLEKMGKDEIGNVAKYRFSLDDLANGSYVIHCKTDNEVFMTKVILL
jgi:aminopeptidase N